MSRMIENDDGRLGGRCCCPPPCTFAVRAQDTRAGAGRRSAARGRRRAAPSPRAIRDAVVAKVGDATDHRSATSRSRSEAFANELANVPEAQQRSVLSTPWSTWSCWRRRARDAGLDKGPEFERAARVPASCRRCATSMSSKQS